MPKKEEWKRREKQKRKGGELLSDILISLSSINVRNEIDRPFHPFSSTEYV